MKNVKIVKAKYVVDSGRRHGKAVMCLDTGEVYTSAKEVCDKHDFKYQAFVSQLRHNRVSADNKLYCYICDMGYYANAIQERIIEQNVAVFNEAVKQYEAAKAHMDMVKMKLN